MMRTKDFWQGVRENDIKKADKVESLGVCTVLYNTMPDGRPMAKMYIGKSGKPQFNYIFKDNDRMNKYISEIAGNVNRNKQAQLDSRKTRLDYKHTLKVGDILTSSWGYDQTNIDFYQVIGVLSKSVVIREIAQHRQEPYDLDSWHTMPLKDRFISNAILKRVKEGNTISMTSYADAYPWDGRPERASDGH